MKLTFNKKFITVVVLTSFLGACSIFKADSRYEPVKVKEIKQTVSLQAVWQSNIGSGGGTGFAPVVQDNSVYAATPDGNVVKLNLDNGSPIWSVKLGSKLTSGVGVGDGLVVVTDKDAKVYALDAQSGKTIWDSKLSTRSTTPPIVAQGKVIVRADDFRVQAFDIKDGKLSWSFVRTNPLLSLKTNSRMSLADNSVVVAVPTGKLVGLGISDGVVNWEILSASAKGPSDIDSVTDVVGQPIVFNDGVCTSSYQGNVSCYRVTNKGLTPIWINPFSSAVGLGTDGSKIYASGIDGTVAKFALANGELIWSDQTLKNRGLTNPVVFKNYVFVGDLDGLVHVFDSEKGTIVGRTTVGSNKDIVSPLIGTEKGVIVQSGSGSLLLFRVN
ncbi:outer membrane protein assembly factor BamB [Taylorella equigenitalis]|uniref:Outer membrane protein assembly factor BamB n=2 Tax=Taylorella equigenitalis TaxID=29575 RepID=A0A654KJ46_TAYEM|nr:outer membrane protein assembly factor BamB [Taylorella equigenitalis]ADU92442.1 Outer membrane protein YfgL [Taylorella equigenitalis MCE9]AFN35992.1 putative quinoprotein [Taylorella equigenitalis ATCC 35865]ASY30624.1 outer membrane protein assembly factor BamB [Taylorella equigenitalis]ASY39406.1 outer membrane protein assembly factor BamB [Taylorella equigenitalis]WDU45775.1 outer membrane protein assembly factor BamB [Taylorella equigenitalis]